jgi:hypothetical protein
MLKPTEIPRPNNIFWLSGNGFVKLVQAEPKREVLFASEAAKLWELIDAEEYTIEELVERMKREGVEEAEVFRLLDEFESLNLITSQNYLWQEEKRT